MTGDAGAGRDCGACSLCCTLLRVDELSKRGGVDCLHQRPEGGCGIYAERPGICRAYRCAWLQGRFAEADRPDRLGAVLDFVNHGGRLMLEIRQAREGAFDASPRLRAIAEAQRALLPVRVMDVADVMDPDRPFRVLLADGEEQRVTGDTVEIHRPGQATEVRRLPLVERLARRAILRLRALRLRRSEGGPQIAKR